MLASERRWIHALPWRRQRTSGREAHGPGSPRATRPIIFVWPPLANPPISQRSPQVSAISLLAGSALVIFATPAGVIPRSTTPRVRGSFHGYSDHVWHPADPPARSSSALEATIAITVRPARAYEQTLRLAKNAGGGAAVWLLCPLVEQYPDDPRPAFSSSGPRNSPSSRHRGDGRYDCSCGSPRKDTRQPSGADRRSWHRQAGERAIPVTLGPRFSGVTVSALAGTTNRSLS